MTLKLTKQAADKVLEIAKEQNKEKFGLKIMAFPGGCAGIQYGLDFEDKPQDNDVVMNQHGIDIYVDNQSIELLKGAKIDYLSDQKGFKIDNPNIKHSCNCGSNSC